MKKSDSTNPGGLAHFPLPLFAVPMGWGGLGLAWREAAQTMSLPGFVGEVFIAFGCISWIFVASLHLLRLTRHADALKADLQHPVRSAFAGAITIGLMLLAGGLLPYSNSAATVLWSVAVASHLAVGIWTVGSLLRAPRESSALTPPLLIPLVGNIVAPVIGAKLEQVDLSWALFGLGALLWIMIQPLLLWRVVAGAPLPAKVKPTLAIFLAPPAVGSVALATLAGGTSSASIAVAGFATFLAVVLLTLFRDFRTLPFSVSWWAWTFPSSAYALCLITISRDRPHNWLTVAASVALVGATIIVTAVSWATLKAYLSGELLQPES